MNKKVREAREPEIATGLQLQDIAYGGETVARLAVSAEDDSGTEAVVFVAGGVPGEVVDVELYRRKKSYLRGNVIRVIEPSKDRRESPCPYFGIEKFPNCGGCQWQHINYTRQLEAKGHILRDQFVRLGGIAEPPLQAPSGALSQWGYRNNVEFQVNEENKPCYHRQNSIRLVPIVSCQIAHPFITLALEPLGLALKKHLPGKVHQVTIRVGPVANAAPVEAHEILALSSLGQDKAEQLAALEKFAAREPLAGALNIPQTTLMFVLRMLGQWTVEDVRPFAQELEAALDRFAPITVLGEGKKRRMDLICGQPYLEETLEGITYRIPPLGFFQSNPVMAQTLINEALAAFDSVGLNWKEAKLLDLYCGVGTFALQMARKGAQVLGVEEYEGAIEYARDNASLNGLEGHARFVAAKAEEYILSLEEPFDGVLVDPPRRGCDPALLDSLLKTRPQTLVYVSCDPSTLARDAKILAAGYRLVSSLAVDLFPQTYHMESVSLFQRI
jgi:23S rRNA (uracil1939-C5)-methyltransferase